MAPSSAPPMQTCTSATRRSASAFASTWNELLAYTRWPSGSRVPAITIGMPETVAISE